MEVAGIWIRQLRWSDWNLIENSDDAWRLHREFHEAGHVFCTLVLDDFAGTSIEADDFRTSCELALLQLITAMRLHKTGPAIDPRYSTRYVRMGSLNLRTYSDYGTRLLEFPPDARYLIEEGDLSEIAFLAEKLEAIAQAPDSGIQLALRNFGFSYGHGLSTTQRLAFLFTALEAVFGEYRKENRPSPKVTLGAAAAAITREAPANSLKGFLDGASAARGLRNKVAHGSLSAPLEGDDPIIQRLENAVRDGLRALVVFAAERSSLKPQLDQIQAGLSSTPPAAAFQSLMSHAAKGSQAARAVLKCIGGQFP
jgi:hypothetical protein